MRYLIRSIKYFVALCVLMVGIMALNLSTGIASLSLDETFYVMFHTPRGMLLPVAVVLLSLFYPKFGFIRRRVEGNMTTYREQLINAMSNVGYSQRSEENGVLRFRADNFVRRLMMLFDDEISVYQAGDEIVLDGNRRGVARVEYRLDSYIRMKKRYDEQE